MKLVVVGGAGCSWWCVVVGCWLVGVDVWKVGWFVRFVYLLIVFIFF